jgi:hypothetical protein
MKLHVDYPPCSPQLQGWNSHFALAEIHPPLLTGGKVHHLADSSAPRMMCHHCILSVMPCPALLQRVRTEEEDFLSMAHEDYPPTALFVGPHVGVVQGDPSGRLELNNSGRWWALRSQQV